MSTNPLFSVLIANFNDGKYINEAIESVFAQSYENWEIIIVDDGSTDNSMNKIRDINDSRVFIYQNESNYGCGYTKRKCVELAHGEICGFLDADDKLTKDAIAEMVSAHIQKPQCSLIYSQFYYTDSQLNILSISDHQCEIPKGETFLTCNISGAVSHFATFKKDFYNRTTGIDDSLRIAEDLDLYFKLEEVGELYFIPSPLYYYRVGTGNNTSLGEENYFKSISSAFIARIKAYQRRQLPVENYIYTTFLSLYNEAFLAGQDGVRNTQSYKIGKIVITPFRFLEKLISK